jgi:hypothetical protein
MRLVLRRDTRLLGNARSRREENALSLSNNKIRYLVVVLAAFSPNSCLAPTTGDNPEGRISVAIDYLQWQWQTGISILSFPFASTDSFITSC